MKFKNARGLQNTSARNIQSFSKEANIFSILGILHHSNLLSDELDNNIIKHGKKRHLGDF